MSYSDDELKIGDLSETEDDFDLDHGPLDPLDDDLAPADEEGAEEGFAGLDGSLY
mgnify:CR=1 FL=1